MTQYLFTSESVSPGHPDKICDQISDLLLDYCIAKEPEARCAFECFATKNNLVISGETRLRAGQITQDVLEGLVRPFLRSIGSISDGFCYDNVKITNLLNTQSPDIAIGVDTDGAGDQGIMFGYACSETESFMPATLYYSHKILENIWLRSTNGIYLGLGPDAKSQVTLVYNGNVPSHVNCVNLSIQHLETLSQDDVRAIVLPIIHESFPEGFIRNETKILVNATGRFTIGGPASDTGLTGRKIIVDTYGGACPHGGGAFSGKDPTKVDRSAAYMLRYIAKNLVASGVCTKTLIQIAYVIGVANPISIYIDCFGTNKKPLVEIVSDVKTRYDLTPRGIRTFLELNCPIYLRTATFGHFGRAGLPWEAIK